MILRIRTSTVALRSRPEASAFTAQPRRLQTTRASEHRGSVHNKQKQERTPETLTSTDSALLTLQAEQAGRNRTTPRHDRYAESPQPLQPVLKPNPYAGTYKVVDEPKDHKGTPTGYMMFEEILQTLSNGAHQKREDSGAKSAASERVKQLTMGLRALENPGNATRPNNRNHTTNGASEPDEDPSSLIDEASPSPKTRFEPWKDKRRCVNFNDGLTVFIRPSKFKFFRGDAANTIPIALLRDACRCLKCVDPSTRQRVHTSPEAWREVQATPLLMRCPKPGEVDVTFKDGQQGLRVQWAPGHSSFYSSAYLQELAFGPVKDSHRLLSHATRVTWDKDALLAQADKLYVQYADLAQPERRSILLDTLIQLQRFGIVIIKGVPTDKTDDQNCSLRKVMGWIGELRNSFYGETWDVKNVANSKNVAYTNLNLGLHMDLLYFSSPPRFQALHCLRNRVEGGSSYFVDAFAAAETFDEKAHDSVPIRFEYDNDSHYLTHTHPLIVGGPKGLRKWYKAAVNWSPPFQGTPVTVDSYKSKDSSLSKIHATHWYRQLDAFQSIIDEPHRRWEFTMEEGDLVLFDNRRVLHARKAFRDLTPEEARARGVEVVEGEPSRWLKGCYLDGEVVWDKLVTLARDT